MADRSWSNSACPYSQTKPPHHQEQENQATHLIGLISFGNLPLLADRIEGVRGHSACLSEPGAPSGLRAASLSFTNKLWSLSFMV